jgi:hypothetical protein
VVDRLFVSEFHGDEDWPVMRQLKPISLPHRAGLGDFPGTVASNHKQHLSFRNDKDSPTDKAKPYITQSV